MKADPIDRIEVKTKLQLMNENNEKLQRLDSDIMDLLLADNADEEGDEENEMDIELAAASDYPTEPERLCVCCRTQHTHKTSAQFSSVVIPLGLGSKITIHSALHTKQSLRYDVFSFETGTLLPGRR
jgi:hypothetical protein